MALTDYSRGMITPGQVQQSPQTTRMTKVFDDINPSEFTRGKNFKEDFLKNMVSLGMGFDGMFTIGDKGLSLTQDNDGITKFKPFPKEGEAYQLYNTLASKYEVTPSMQEFKQVYHLSKQLYDKNLKSKLYEANARGVPMENIASAIMGTELEGYLASSVADVDPEGNPLNQEFMQFLPSTYSAPAEWSAMDIAKGVGGAFIGGKMAMAPAGAKAVKEIMTGAKSSGTYGRIARGLVKVLPKKLGIKAISILARTAARGMMGPAGWAMLAYSIYDLAPNLRDVIGGIFAKETGLPPQTF